MHIMMVCSFPTTRLVGGDSVAANELARCYMQAGHQVTLVSICRSGFDGWRKTIIGLDSIGFRPRYGKRAARVLDELLDVYDPKALAFLRQQLEQRQPDCVHFHGEHNGVSAHGPVVTKALRIPAVLTLHGPWVLCAAYNLARLPDYRACSGPGYLKCLACRRPGFPYRIPIPFRNYVVRGGILSADLVTVASRFLADRLLRGGYPRSKVIVIPHGVDEHTFRPRFGGSGDSQRAVFRVLFVGRVRYKKGVDHLVEACARLVGEGFPVQLDIVGDMVRPAAAGRCFVRYRGEVSRRDLPECYQEADVLVQPSLIHEGFGLTILEAMACGTPVVASAMGAMPEVVEDCGLLVPAGNPDALASAMRRLILQPDLRKRLGSAGRARVEGRFTWRAVAAEYLQRFTDLRRAEGHSENEDDRKAVLQPAP